MKKLLFGCLILITACQSATPTPAPLLFPIETPLPTLVPATSTPELPPTLEPSPPPFPKFFTNEFDLSLAGWVILQAGNDAVPNINTGNSNLILQMDSPHTWVYVLYGAQDYANVRVDTSFENRAGSPSSIGVICRYTEEKGWFEFNISTDGTYNVLYGNWLTVGIADYLPILGDESEYIQPSGTLQEIGMLCEDKTLWLYINQKLFRKVDVARYELTEGKVGITASSFENFPVIAAFDWVKVSEASSP